jgi:spore coat protein U-like protein
MVKRIILIVAIAMIAFSGVALAADTTSVTVSATVQGTCKFLTSGTIDFGTLDPNSNNNVTGTVAQPTFWCTKNASYTITDQGGGNDSGGIHRMVGATHGDFIPYSFSFTGSGTGQGRTSTLSMNIASQVVFNDYRNASEDTYSDTVTLSINP